MNSIKKEMMRRDRSRSPVDRNGDRRNHSDKFGRKPSIKQVCVANIPFNMNWQEVKDLFREKVGDVNFVRLFEDSDGKSKGMGLIEFAHPSSVVKALEEMHRYEVNGRKLVVKEDYDIERDRFGKPVPRRDGHDDRHPSAMGMRKGKSPGQFFGPPKLEGQWGDERDYDRAPYFETYGLSEDFLDSLGITGPLINKVFISNIDYNVTEKKLKEVFKLAGKIDCIDFMTDEEGKSRGRAVVEYDHPLEAVQAISMLHKQRLYDRDLSVELDKLEKGKPFNAIPSGLKSVGRGLGPHGEAMNVKEALRRQSGPPDDNSTFEDSRQVPDSRGSQSGDASIGAHPALASLSQSQLLALISSGLLSSGSGNPAAAPIHSNIASGLGSASTLNPTMMHGPGSIGKMASQGSAYDQIQPSGYKKPAFSDEKERRHPSSDNIFRENSNYSTIVVRNLPNHYTWEALRAKFNDVGDVTYADIRNRGSGLVRFASVRDAERAVNLLHGTRIEGRAIEVQMY